MGKPIPGWVNRLAGVDEDNDSDFASNASTDSHAEDPDHHLLTNPSSEIPYLKDKPVGLAKQLM
ncbi:hypothetical protein QQ045_020712 [Rhodiola kirilowii]